MATITIENVPESVVKSFGTKIKFDYNLSFQKDDKVNNELEWTDYEEKAYLKGKKDFENGDIINGKDFFNSVMSKNV